MPTGAPAFYLTADMAEACARAGLTIRTSAAVRQAVYSGRLHPTGFSPRRVCVWTEEDARKDILRLVEADALRREAFDLGRAQGRQDAGNGVQGELFQKGGGR